MTAVVDWVVGMTLWTAFVVVAARVADRFLERRVSARWRMALYAAVAVRLALPVRWDGGVAASAASHAVTTLTESAVRVASFPTAAVAGETGGSAWMPWTFAAVYAAGVVALVAVRVIAWRRGTVGLRPARPSLAALSPAVPVFESDDFGPAVVGVTRPRIVVPSHLAETADPSTLAWIVRHETSHVAARDPLLLAAAQVAVAALWPVLPLWFALARVRALMEVACDERTLAASAADGRRGYVRALLLVTESASRRVRPPGALAFGHGLAERSRVLASSARAWPRAVQALGVAVVAAGVVACASDPAPAAPRDVADGVLVSVDSVPGVDATVTGDDGVERPSAVHIVNARLYASKPGEAMVVTSRGGIVASSLGGDAGSVQLIRFSGDAAVEGIDFVTAPSVIAIDGEQSSVTLDWRQGEPDSRHCSATYTVRSAGEGAVDLVMSFQQTEGGIVVRHVPATTIRLAPGEKALVVTSKPGR